MEANLAAALGVEADRVNVKATTEERLGFTGDGSGMAAHAVALLERHPLSAEKDTPAGASFLHVSHLPPHTMGREEECLWSTI